MKPEFRPIPITILDFMAILLPGCVWLTLFVITGQIVTKGSSRIITSPIRSLLEFSSQKEVAWVPMMVAFVGVAVLIGYVLKPIAMRSAETISAPFFKLQKKFRGIRLRTLRFPFKTVYEDQPYYKQVCDLIERDLGGQNLPGNQPFSAAKRYLRLTAPTLWEESERMEAEVRMAGVLLLAALYSFLLSIAVMILNVGGKLHDTHWWNLSLWLSFSLLSILILAIGFNRLRVREVGYTYANALTAWNVSKSTKLQAREDL